MIKKHTNIKTVLSVVVLTITSFASQADGWEVGVDEQKSCGLITKVVDKKTGKNIASFGLLKLSRDINEGNEYINNLLVADSTLILERKRRLKVEVGVGAKIYSTSFSDNLDYTSVPGQSERSSIFTAASGLRDNVITALLHDEEITIEFNTASYDVRYGVMSSKAFKENLKIYNKCLLTLQ